jgi:enoyl-CoA hydratase/carnithine racemase
MTFPAPAQEAKGEPRFAEIIYEKRDWVAHVIINRPEVYNTYTSTTLQEMTWAFRNAALDDRVAVVVLTGAGDRAFCAGSDIKQHCEEHIGNPSSFNQWMKTLIEAHEALRQVGKPSIARINGIVAGGGNEWNLACDLAIAADHSKFVQIEAKVGTVAASGATQWLPLLVGERRAREILLTGEPISANKALLWGLVNDVVPYKELDGAVEALCLKLIEKFPGALRFTRQQLGFWKDFAWESTIEEAREWLTNQFASEEMAEGIKALAERREINYREFRARASDASEMRIAGKRREELTNRFQPPKQDRAQTSKQSTGENSTGRLCFSCGAQGLPASFEYCGRCGARLA